MKKYLFPQGGRLMVSLLAPLLLVVLIVFQSCKKEDPAGTDPNTNNSGGNPAPNPAPTVNCPTFNNLEVIYAGNTYSVTSSLISCEDNSGRWVVNHGSTSGTRVRVVFAAKPQAAKNYTVVDGEDGKEPGADECYIQIQTDATTIWNSKAGGKVLACTKEEDGSQITRAKWEGISIEKLSDGTTATTAGQTGCIE